MRHEPSTYIGIGNDGFRAIEPITYIIHESSGFSRMDQVLPKHKRSFFERCLPGGLIFGFVFLFLAYFFLLI
jgi:hypothetical protein